VSNQQGTEKYYKVQIMSKDCQHFTINGSITPAYREGNANTIPDSDTILLQELLLPTSTLKLPKSVHLISTTFPDPALSSLPTTFVSRWISSMKLILKQQLRIPLSLQC
jgi:hypothetical protein